MRNNETPIQESLINQSSIIGKLDYNNQQLFEISQQIQRVPYRESSRQPPRQPPRILPPGPTMPEPDFQSVIDKFNANDSNWFREQIELDFFQKVQAKEIPGSYGRVIQISLQPSGLLLKYKVNGTEWVIPNRQERLWLRAINQSLFSGSPSNNSPLIRPAKLELRDNIWQVKEPGQFQ